VKLVVIPSDPLEAYEKKGTYTWLEEYFNPLKTFSEVFLVSPLEREAGFRYGMNIIPVRNQREYRKTLRKLKPDAIRAYGGYWASDFAVYNRVGDIPVVVSVHDTNPELLHGSVRYADYVICMSEVVRQMVLEKGIRMENTTVLGNRVDLDLFRSYSGNEERVIKVREGFPEGKFILHIGRQSEQKNQSGMIRALALLDKSYFMVFVGQGNSAPFMEEAEKLGVRDRCYWVPSVANNILPLWYAACDLFCVPSLWEGFGLVFIEAAACRVPVITSDISPMNEFLANRRNALLIADSRDPEQIRDTILEAIADPGLMKEISGNIYEVALRYSKAVIDQREAATYMKIVTEKPVNEYLSKREYRKERIDSRHKKVFK